MNRTPSDPHSNPLSKVFSKIFGRDDERTPEPARPEFPKPRASAAASPKPATRPAVRTTPAATAPASTSPRPDFSNVRSGSSTAPATAAPATASARTPRTHTVERGDSLSKIAQQVYGRADRWKLIFDANRDRLDDPDLIYPGQVLVLPDAPADS